MKQFWIFIVLCCLGCQKRNIKTIVVRGSDTEVNLVLMLAESYMSTHPDVSIAVTGGGSGTGIAALINKKTDIANSSRAFKPIEIKLAKERNVDVTPIIFAVDALSFIVNESSVIDSLSLTQAQEIYTGKITNWSIIGGKDQEISLYGRQSNSGTYSFIQEHILKGDYSLHMKQMNGTSQIIENIKNDVAGIGYVGIGYIINEGGQVIDGIKVLKIYTDNQHKAITPVNSDNIHNGTYPIVRPLYQYLDGKPTDELKNFIVYELSAEGQKIISKNGYFPITEANKTINNKCL
ncbi:phosphate ABC transporter substrate-binding protein (PhoT family) [Tenacibaculum adriaticum]|uniref:Phosphate-binding protein n=1 Tax=Tenacibaculum adriaticum TaxID=413713 RepID=A0A5S5DT59_9FLAO|nr:phosphate ABC transporter substrate-binding protein [Tenacibaculum adriaticum]TYP98965.1 phosphate ABC transporter substrate-binding protein (PhoT family) [Tenacibaculum adriaticum]